MVDPRKHIMIKIPPHGPISLDYFTKKPDYKMLREAVGGMIQEVPYFTKMTYNGRKFPRGIAYANEEGFMLNLPDNMRARELWRIACPTGDPDRMYLCGTVIFVCKEPNDEHARREV